MFSSFLVVLFVVVVVAARVNLYCDESYNAYDAQRAPLKRSRDFDLYCITYTALDKTEQELSRTRNGFYTMALENERLKQEKERLKQEKEACESELKRLREYVAAQQWLAEQIAEAKFDIALHEAEGMLKHTLGDDLRWYE